MKRVYFLLVLIYTILGVIAFTACKKKDNAPPDIQLNGEDTMDIPLRGTFDPGATAYDDVDGVIVPSVKNNVNVNSAGMYTITYTATDYSGNESSKNRTVIVSAALYIAGYYKGIDICDGITSPVYHDTITSSLHVYNKIHFKRFAGYINAGVDATITGTTIIFEHQNVLCGLPPIIRTFSGSGSFTADSIIIQYTMVPPDSIVKTGTNRYGRE
jgi:hypothetical protein